MGCLTNDTFFLSGFQYNIYAYQREFVRSFVQKTTFDGKHICVSQPWQFGFRMAIVGRLRAKRTHHPSNSRAKPHSSRKPPVSVLITFLFVVYD